MNAVEEEEKLVNPTSETSLNVSKLCNDDSSEIVANPGTSNSIELNNDSESLKDSSVTEKTAVVGVFYNDQNGDDNNVDHSNDNELECKSRTNCDNETVKEDGFKDVEEREQSDIKDPVNIVLSSEQLLLLTKEELITKWTQLQRYVCLCQSKLKLCEQEVEDYRRQQLNEDKLKSQLQEFQRKEQYHIMRLTTKEHELQELGAQVDELKSLTVSGGNLKHSFIDPAVNLLFERMKRDFDSTKSKMEETQNELSAWKFTPDSNTGKQLMAKCRLLIKENEELGKMISSGRLAKLEEDLSLQRNFSEELKKSQSEVDEFLQEMDEDTEGMQGTILLLQSQLRQAKEKISHLSSQLCLGQGTSNNTPASTAEYESFDLEPTDDSLPGEGRTNGDLSELSHSSDNLISKSERKRTLSEPDDAAFTKRTRTADDLVVENGIPLADP